MGYLIFATVDTYCFVTMWYTIYQILFWPLRKIITCCCCRKSKKPAKKQTKEESSGKKVALPEKSNPSPKKSAKKNKQKSE